MTTLAALDGDVSTTVDDEPSASTAGASDGSTGGGDSGAGGTPGAGGDTAAATPAVAAAARPAPAGARPAVADGGTPQPNPPAPSTLEYPIDARFGAAGATRARTGLEPLRALPSEDNPAVIYLGSSDDRREATFLVSAELEVQGDGTCRPSRNECTTLLLEAGDTAILDGARSRRQAGPVRARAHTYRHDARARRVGVEREPRDARRARQAGRRRLIPRRRGRPTRGHRRIRRAWASCASSPPASPTARA